MSEPILVGVPEACRLLGISKATLFRLVKAERLPKVKIGTRTLFDVRDLRGLAAASKVTTPELEEQTAAGAQPSKAALRALHGKASQLDRRDREEPGTWKRSILARASRKYGRTVTSASDLSADEVDWILDQLTEEIESAR